MSLNGLSPEIWVLIFQSLLNREDLANVCRVSRAFDALAMPVLYRSVIFRTPSVINRRRTFSSDIREQADVLTFAPLDRLLDERNERLRLFVREINFEDGSWPDQAPEDLINSLLKKLPNLESIYTDLEIPTIESFVQVMLSRKRVPRLHLRGEQGFTPVITKMPFVTEICTHIDATASRHGGEESRNQKLALHELFKAYPNLESLSLKINYLRGGCLIGGIPTTRISPLTLSENETFPPLRSLTISGYRFKESEASVWKKKFPWDQLQSLSVGPQNALLFPDIATGFVHNLKKFELKSYGRVVERVGESMDALDAFLSSFCSLEILITKGFVPSVDAVAHHPDLKILCLHEIETPGKERKNLEAKEIEYLDRNCPKLTDLEIDINPEGAWPNNTINALSKGFRNLRRLSIHVGLGIAKLEDLEDFEMKDAFIKSFQSVLTESTAQDFAKSLFDRRGPSGIPITPGLKVVAPGHLKLMLRWKVPMSRASKGVKFMLLAGKEYILHRQ
ncbi:hypothetical protein N7495_004647 [Penicillium taxi]|uniref:uncharacterized protein n=1 Tax=Penicillium taxi TaxID=168475 RepID=UPI002544DE52|nr:uncharacterized protein N7495_004647 [Penicillium taxi]KAJ5899903.1 hypothetical protein N7495_004647 [Penicillium taxi]